MNLFKALGTIFYDVNGKISAKRIFGAIGFGMAIYSTIAKDGNVLAQWLTFSAALLGLSVAERKQ